MTEWLLPLGLRPSATTVRTRGALASTAALWTPADLERLAGALDLHGRRALESLDDESLLRAFDVAVGRLREPTSLVRRQLDPALSITTDLSRAGLEAALETMLGGVAGANPRRLLETAPPQRGGGLLVIVLAGNVPGLAVQPVLASLLARRPMLVKSSTAEPLFAPAFAHELVSAEPGLGAAVAAVSWPGGDPTLEAPVLDRAERVVVYGGDETIRSLRARVGNRLVAYGPGLSVAILGDDVDPVAVAPLLARDVALFEQRGCLSLQAILTLGPARALASALTAELARMARRWPPPDPDPRAASMVQQLRLEARLRGLWVSSGLPLRHGTVVVEPTSPVSPSPGLRTVVIHPTAGLDAIANSLAPLAGRLQGAALAGRGLGPLRPALETLGATWITEPGRLHSVDATWRNGGHHPVAVLA